MKEVRAYDHSRINERLILMKIFFFRSSIENEAVGCAACSLPVKGLHMKA